MLDRYNRYQFQVRDKTDHFVHIEESCEWQVEKLKRVLCNCNHTFQFSFPIESYQFHKAPQGLKLPKFECLKLSSTVATILPQFDFFPFRYMFFDKSFYALVRANTCAAPQIQKINRKESCLLSQTYIFGSLRAKQDFKIWINAYLTIYPSMQKFLRCCSILFSETALTAFFIYIETFPRDNFQGSFLNVPWLPSSLKVHLAKTLFILPLLLAKSGRLNAFYLEACCDGLSCKKLFSFPLWTLGIIGRREGV